jgi:tetratricopeptide (TPR) repeat protein
MRLNPTIIRASLLASAGVLAVQGQRFHATLVTEDGTPPAISPQITPDLTQRLVPGCRILSIFGNGTVEYLVDWRSRPYDPATADLCSVTIRLNGFRTTQTTLRHDAVIVLKRIGFHEGSTVSMTEIRAPEPARKAYAKGVAAMNRKKWAAAQKDFEQAVEIYPAYAAAWSDLGEILNEQSKSKDAHDAWDRAVQADPKYIKPYLQLTKLALDERRTEDAVSMAERTMAINSTEFPVIYYYHAAANYNLKHFDVAEKSARRAIDLDSNHELPRAELLLGSTLAAEGDRRGAVEHLKKYLKISPKSVDAAQVERAIVDLERTAGEAK